MANFGIPSDLLTSQKTNARALKIASFSSTAFAVAEGQVFSGSFLRSDVPANTPGGDIFGSVFKTGDKWAYIIDVDVEVDISAISDGKVVHKIEAYMSNSNRSTFTYSGGIEQPAGVNLNANKVNDLPVSTNTFGVTIDSLTGDFDYPFFFRTYFVDTQGNRSTQTFSENSFFQDGRRILVPPNTEALIVATTDGGATGTSDIRTLFFLVEVDESIIPPQ